MKILLFGDAPMAQNEGGINQTLYNLFCFIKPADFLGITEVDQNTLKKIGSVEPYTSRYLSYKLDLITMPVNRFTRFLMPMVKWVNFLMYKNNHYTKLKQQIAAFKPDVVISCSNSATGILMYDKLIGKNSMTCPVIPYFMDDWMYNLKPDVSGKFIQNIIQKMLQNNKYWMMISKELSELLAERYQAKPEKVLCIRNPVDLSDAPTDQNYQKKEPFEIAYAGALWPMHFDSFYAVAKAVSKTGNVKLKLYTQESQWNWRKNQLEPLGVIYGGHIPYQQIHGCLNQADALLITASFENENYTHTKASLQTKITDYCKSRRLIISCAPSYAANNTFIKAQNCGICIETNNQDLIKEQLTEIASNIYNYQYYVENAYNTLKDFTQEKVHNQIREFLQQTVN